MAPHKFTKLALAAALVSLGFGLDASAQASSTPATNPGASSSKSGAGGPGMSGAGTSTPSSSDQRTGARTEAKSGAKSSVSSGERKFMETAAKDSMAEIQMGQLAQQKAQSPQVKDFAKRMVDDHTKASEELKQVAGGKGVALPTELDRSHKRHADDMQKKSADKFDKDYMDMMVKEHQKDVKEFQKQAKSAKDPEVRAFAEKNLPTLQAHLQAAQSTRDSVKSGGKAGKS